MKKYNCSTRPSTSWKRRFKSSTVNFTSPTWPSKNWSKLMRPIKIFSTRRKNTGNNIKQSKNKCRNRSQLLQRSCRLLVNLLWQKNLRKSCLCFKGNLTKCRNSANNFKNKELPYFIRLAISKNIAKVLKKRQIRRMNKFSPCRNKFLSWNFSSQL